MRSGTVSMHAMSAIELNILLADFFIYVRFHLAEKALPRHTEECPAIFFDAGLSGHIADFVWRIAKVSGNEHFRRAAGPYLPTYLQIYIHTYIHTYYIYTYVCMHTYILYTHARTHARTHTHILKEKRGTTGESLTNRDAVSPHRHTNLRSSTATGGWELRDVCRESRQSAWMSRSGEGGG